MLQATEVVEELQQLAVPVTVITKDTSTIRTVHKTADWSLRV